jgi:hypothetical protein
MEKPLIEKKKRRKQLELPDTNAKQQENFKEQKNG